MTVLSFSAASFFQIGFMYSVLDALELCSSPESIINGLPSTIIWVTAPVFLRYGIGEAGCFGAGAGPVWASTAAEAGKTNAGNQDPVLV